MSIMVVRANGRVSAGTLSSVCGISSCLCPDARLFKNDGVSIDMRNPNDMTQRNAANGTPYRRFIAMPAISNAPKPKTGIALSITLSVAYSF